jgi:hypothetical protein
MLHRVSRHAGWKVSQRRKISNHCHFPNTQARFCSASIQGFIRGIIKMKNVLQSARSNRV